MTQIAVYQEIIKKLPQGEWSRSDILIPELLLHEEQGLRMYYAPYDDVNPEAKVIIAGITPGFTQMSCSLRQARQDLLHGVPINEIDARAKIVASFAGTMRRNLIAMLDEMGLAALLGLTGSEQLFGEYRHLLHTTSVIRYPAFYHGDNYTGHQPKLLASGLLRGYALVDFARELAAVRNAVIIPLGKSVSDVLRAIAQQGTTGDAPEVLLNRSLLDFPHPSGANGHRWKQFAGLKEQHKETLQRHWTQGG